jgi:hypothetical protein
MVRFDFSEFLWDAMSKAVTLGVPVCLGTLGINVPKSSSVTVPKIKFTLNQRPLDAHLAADRAGDEKATAQYWKGRTLHRQTRPMPSPHPTREVLL